jgi:hypothetical protein
MCVLVGERGYSKCFTRFSVHVMTAINMGAAQGTPLDRLYALLRLCNDLQ